METNTTETTKTCSQCRYLAGDRCEGFLPEEDNIFQVRKVTDTTPACDQFEVQP